MMNKPKIRLLEDLDRKYLSHQEFRITEQSFDHGSTTTKNGIITTTYKSSLIEITMVDLANRRTLDDDQINNIINDLDKMRIGYPMILSYHITIPF